MGRGVRRREPAAYECREFKDYVQCLITTGCCYIWVMYNVSKPLDIHSKAKDSARSDEANTSTLTLAKEET